MREVHKYAAIVSIYLNEGEMESRVEMNQYGYLILTMGGVGISLGLLLYGYKIIRAIGVKLSCITPSRGFSIELGSSTIIIIGSFRNSNIEKINFSILSDSLYAGTIIAILIKFIFFTRKFVSTVIIHLNY